MKFQLTKKTLDGVDCEYLILLVFDGTYDHLPHFAREFLEENPKFGKNLYDAQILWAKNKKTILLGAGKREKWSYEVLQNLAGVAVKIISKKCKKATFTVPTQDLLLPEEVSEAIVIGAEIAMYDCAKEYKSDYEQPRLSCLEILVEKFEKGYQGGITRGTILAEAINLARKLGDMPANEMTPMYFLNQARRLTKINRLKITAIDEKKAKKMGLGGFCGVAKGSDEPGFMIVMEYEGDPKSKEKWGFVGKGITFDTGGISIKPSAQMHEMKYDMCGAAAVLGVIVAASKLKVKANIVSVMAVTENLPSGKAQRPGDILKLYCGKTAEILSTDAEGRLVLADGLSLAQKDYRATKLIDLATLTGAIMVSLGDIRTGAFGNNPKFTQDVIIAGSKGGEKIWEMPMDEEYEEMIKSDIADMTNVGHGGGSMPKSAGAITAAKFLEHSLKDNIQWVHLDIAGTAWDMQAKPYRGVGATGVGVKTLIKLIC